MFGRSGNKSVIADAKRSIWPYARQVQEDEKLRERLLAAVAAGFAAWQRVRGLPRTTAQLVADPVLRRELKETVKHLEEAQKRVQHRRSRRLRNSLLVLAGVGAFAAALKGVAMRWWPERTPGSDTRESGSRTAAAAASPTSTTEPAAESHGGRWDAADPALMVELD